MNIKDSNVTINVRDMEKSVAFYISIGFKLKHRWENHYAQLTAPGIVIGLHPTKGEFLVGGSGNVSIGFTAQNYKEAVVNLTELSIAAEARTEEGGEFVHFNDPDGTALYLINPKSY